MKLFPFPIHQTVNCEVSLRSYSFDNQPNGDRYGFIRVNDEEIMRVDHVIGGDNLKRGINTVVLDPKTGQAGDQQTFDTCDSASKTTDLINYLNGLSTGTILLGVTFEEPFRSLSAALPVLLSMGVDVASVRYRGMFAFVLQKGSPSKTVLAKSASRASPLELAVQLSGNVLSMRNVLSSF